MTWVLIAILFGACNETGLRGGGRVAEPRQPRGLGSEGDAAPFVEDRVVSERLEVGESRPLDLGTDTEKIKSVRVEDPAVVGWNDGGKPAIEGKTPGKTKIVVTFADASEMRVDVVVEVPKDKPLRPGADLGDDDGDGPAAATDLAEADPKGDAQLSETDVDGKSPMASITDGELTVKELCKDASRQKRHEERIVFASNWMQSCEWGQNGNANAGAYDKNGIAAERTEERPLDLAAKDGSVICSMSLKASGSIQVDDELVVTLDGRVLATNWDSEAWMKKIGFATEAGGLLLYDRSRVIGKQWEAHPRPYCAPNMRCNLDIRQQADSTQAGTVNLEMDATFLDQLPAEVKASPKHKLGVHTTGNDGRRDCSHTEIAFDLVMTYVE